MYDYFSYLCTSFNYGLLAKVKTGIQNRGHPEFTEITH